MLCPHCQKPLERAPALARPSAGAISPELSRELAFQRAERQSDESESVIYVHRSLVTGEASICFTSNQGSMAGAVTVAKFRAGELVECYE
jgi:hypothetical protein